MDSRYDKQSYLDKYRKYYKLACIIKPMITYNKVNVITDCELVDTTGMNFKGALVVLYGPKHNEDPFDTFYVYDTDLSHNFDQSY